MEDQSEPVRVFIRIRPEFEERTAGNTPSKLNSRGQPTLTASESAAQEDIYRSVSEHVHATVNGYNTTIFAYGTTGSGKSYTMTGNKQSPGIIPRAIGDLFRHIENAAAEENDVFFYVRLSYVELYNNTFRNLLEGVHKDRAGQSTNRTNLNMSMNGFFTELDDGGGEGNVNTSFATARHNSQFDMKLHPGLAHRTDKIEVRESQSAGVFLAGPNLRIPVTSAMEAFQLIAKGNKMRAVGSTACNDVSSRSHAILTFHVESRILSSKDGTSTSNTGSASVKSELRLGKIHLVDLAGSERLALSGAEGETRLETQNINLSLTALGDVLSALSKNATIYLQQQKQLNASRSPRVDSSFDGTGRALPVLVPVPYRNSKLTHLLKDSLGGNSKTVMITTIRRTDEYYQQTAISLMYASRAKKVRNRSLVNRNVIGDTGIHAVSSEIERLKKSLEERSVEFDRLRMAQLQDAQENSALKVRLQELKVANDNEKALLEQQVSHVIHSQAGHIAAQREKITTLQSALQEELTLSQNRIAEQEKEIKWLKKALDETSQAAQGPYDQMQRLQKMVEAWQTQAKTTHHELSVVLKQAEELKTLNSQLTSKLHEVEAAKRQLQEEISEHEQETLDVAAIHTKATREKEELAEQLESTARAYQDAKAALKDKAQALFDKEFVLKEHAKLISSLEAELKVTKETGSAVQKDAHQAQAKLTARIADLESEKDQLNSRLNNAVSTLEKSTARVVEDANSKMQAKDSKLKQADEKATQLLTEVDHYKKLVEDYKRQLDTREAVHEQAIADLQNSLKDERVANSQQAARILSLEGLADGFRDKILNLKTKDKEMMDSLREQVEKHEKELREKDRALYILGEQRSSERVSLMTEFERILEEKTLKHQTDLEEAHAGATFSAERMEEIEAKHREELLRLRVEYESKESFFQHQLQETETQVKSMIEHEIETNIKRLEAQHQQTLQKVRLDHEQELRTALQEALASSASAAHKQHVQSLEQRHSTYTAELDTMRNEFQLQLKAAQDDAAAQREEIKRAHEERVAKLGRTHQQALDQLETKISDQCEKHYDDHLRARDEKHRQELAAAVEKEHKKLTVHYESLVQSLREDTAAMKTKHEQALKNLEIQRDLYVQDAIDAERSKLLLKSREASEEQRNALSHEFVEQLHDQEKKLTAKFTAQLEAQRKQVMGEQEEALQQLADEQRRQIDALNAEKKEAEAHHLRELDLLINSNKKQLSDTRKETDVLLRVQQEDAERALQALREQMDQRKLDFEEQLREALSDQQKELIDRARNESVKLRAELQAMEARHQAELNSALQEHVQEMAKQRKQLETAQGNLVNSLQEELVAAKDRCNELMVLSAAKEAQDASALLEVKARADENTRRLLEDREKQHKVELEGAESFANAELNKLRLSIDKMKARHAVELLSKEKEATGDQNRAIAQLKEKHRAELTKLKAQQDQRMTSAVKEIAGKGKLDYLRLIEEKKDDDRKHAAALEVMEQKIRDLNQALQKARVDAEMEVLQQAEELKRVRLEAQVQKDEVEARYASLQGELESRFEDKHLLVLDTVREEGAAELTRVREEAQISLQKKEAQHQRELEQMRRATEEERNERIDELEQLGVQLSEMQRKFNAATAEAKALQEELAELRAQHEEEAFRSNKLGSDVSDLTRRHTKEVQRLKDERAEYERMSVEAEEGLAKELQEVKLASRKLTSELQEALMEKEFEREHQLGELRQQNLAETQEQINALKRAHQEQLEQARSQREAESALLEEARVQCSALTAEVAKSAANLEAVQRECAEQVENMTQQAANESKFLRERITRLTQEAEDLAAEMEMRMEKRTECLEESLEEEKQRASHRHEQHLSELQALQAQMQTAIQAERVQKANELDEQRHALETAHQREIKELKIKLEAGATLTSGLKDEMSSRLSAALAEKEAQLRELQEHMKAQLSTALAEREQQLRVDFERERSRLSEQYEDSLQQTLQSSRSELVRRMEELTNSHSAEITAMQKRHTAALRDHVEDSGSEVVTLQRQLGEKDEEKRDVQRQLAKSEAIREVLKQDTENMRGERQQLREKVHVLELEIIEHGKAKFDARISAEKERLDLAYKASFEAVNQEVEAKVVENKELASKLAHTEMEIAAMRASLRSAQEERERLELAHRDSLTEKEAAHVRELQSALETQQEELQAEYLRLIQQQVDSLVGLIQNQSLQSGSFDLQERFLMLIRQLPDNWRHKHSSFTVAPSSPPPFTPPAPPAAASKRAASDLPRTPLHLLGQAARGDRDVAEEADQDLESVRRSRFGGGRQSLPWSSPSLRSSPTDQLIAAILDGDVQGIRAVVRSKGEDLRSEFWRELTRSVFPLHRAVSGLHFHGSEKLLVATIETLAQLGADVNACDHAGNSVLHKAIQVCTSKSAAAVVRTLLQRGANPTLKNKDGDTALHSECKRVRSASVDVIDSLISAGADPNCRNLSSSSSSVTPLTLVLLRGAASTSTGVRLIGVGEEVGMGLGLSPPSNSRITADGRSMDLDNLSVSSNQNTAVGTTDPERSRVAGRRVWIRAAEMLIKCGAHWDANWQTNRGCTQLHLLLSAFPPPRDDSATYRKLLKSCIDSGLDVAIQEERGRSALFVLCEQMATVGSETCPDAPRLVHMLLGGANPSHNAAPSMARKVVNAADHTGRTVFDIVERTEHSCLSVCRSMLRDASQGVLQADGSAYASSTGSRRGVASGGNSSLGGGDWEVERPSRSTSALIARVSQMSSSGIGSSSARGEVEAKRKSSYMTTATSSISSTAARVASNTAYNSRHPQEGSNNSSSYLDDAFPEPPIPLLRGPEHALSSSTASYYSPAVVARRSNRAAFEDK